MKKLTVDNSPAARLPGMHWRKYRVYVTQYSNAGTAWITFEGKRTIIS